MTDRSRKSFFSFVPSCFKVYWALGKMWQTVVFGASISRWLFQVLETQLSCTTALQLVSGSRITRATREMWQLSGLATNSIFFCFFFLWPLVSEHNSLPFLPSTPLSCSRTFENLFGWNSSLNLALCIVSGTTKKSITPPSGVSCVGVKVPGHCQKQLTQT